MTSYMVNQIRRLNEARNLCLGFPVLFLKYVEMWNFEPIAVRLVSMHSSSFLVQ